MKGFSQLLSFFLLAQLPMYTLGDSKVTSLEATRSEWSTYRFPLFEGESPALDRINTYLHVLELDSLPGSFEQSPFEQVWPKEGEGPGVTSLDYEIHAQTAGFVSLDIMSEYVGAYLSLGSSSYAFELTDGQPLSLPALLSEPGLQRLRERLSEARVARIEEFLAQLATDAPGEDAEFAAIQRDMYEHCLPRLRDTGLEQDRLVLEKTQLTLIAGRCSAHAVRALDDLGEFANSFAYAELAEDLSPYGRCLLLELRGDCANLRKPQIAGVYRGDMDHQPILVITPPSADGSSRALYFSDDRARMVELSVQHSDDGNLAKLKNLADESAISELRLGPAGRLSGTWNGAEGPQSVSLR